jgi:chromosomal replication initiation ATPase DnaA
MNARQLAFDLPFRVARDREDFLVTHSNAAAVQLIDQWPNWPSHAALIVGPHGCGKTHLCHVFARVSGAPVLPLAALTVPFATGSVERPIVAIEIDDEANIDERALFHLLNRARQTAGHLLLTATVPVGQWGIGLPDLASRLAAIPVVTVASPDEELLQGVLLKQFNDRQLMPQPNALSYLVQRMPRSLDAVARLAEEIDRRALEERKALSRPFVAKVLSDLFSGANDEA